MSDTFLHGVEVVEIESGPRPIQTVRSSVIGIVGTAPEVAPSAVAASLLLGETGLALDEPEGPHIVLTAVTPGAAGNSISFRIRNTTDDVPPSVAVLGSAIVVTLPDTGMDDQQLIDLINGDPSASALVTASLGEWEEELTANHLAGPTLRPLTGGADAGPAVDTPFLVVTQDDVDALGSAGTLPAALRAIRTQAGAVVVAIRVDGSGDANQTRTNVIGDPLTRTGCYAFEVAKSQTGMEPKILIAPEFTSQTADDGVVAALVAVATKLAAVVVADDKSANFSAFSGRMASFGSERVYFVHPHVIDSGGVERPASGYVAGLIAKSDNERGFWWSPSNQEILGLTGTSRAVAFKLGDPNSEANLFNEIGGAVIIREQGFRLWGNRTRADDPLWAFLSVRRAADIIYQSVQEAHRYAVDRNITKTFLEDVAESVNAYLRTLEARGAILGGRCSPNPDLNTAANIQQGKVYFDIDWTPVYPAERISFRAAITDEYIARLLT